MSTVSANSGIQSIYCISQQYCVRVYYVYLSDILNFSEILDFFKFFVWKKRPVIILLPAKPYEEGGVGGAKMKNLLCWLSASFVIYFLSTLSFMCKSIPAYRHPYGISASFCDILLVNFIILCVRPARKSFGKRCLFSKERLNFTAEGVGCVIGFGDRKESSKTGIYH